MFTVKSAAAGGSEPSICACVSGSGLFVLVCLFSLSAYNWIVRRVFGTLKFELRSRSCY